MKNKQSDTKKPHSSSGDQFDIGRDISNSVVVTGDRNTIIVKPNILIIVVALIVFAILVVLFLGSMKMPALDGGAGLSSTVTVSTTPTFPPTDTATPSRLPSTATATDTPSPTPIPTSTPIPPVKIGEDWIQGCISTLWKAYPATVQPTERGDGCWREPVNAFSAENGDLDFLAERKGGPAEVYGLFAPLPENGTVTFTIRLKDLNNADLWMGVFAEPDVTSQGLLMTILNGDVSRRSFVQKDPLTYETMQGTIVLEQGYGYSVSFTFKTLSVISKVNPNVFVTNPFSLQSSPKWLFLGYKGLRGAYRIEGTFLNFELK